MDIENKETDQPKIEIKMKLKKQGRLLATFALTLHTGEFGDIEMRGFRVMSLNDSDDLWIEPPSYLSFGSYHKFLFFHDPIVWKTIKEKATDKYKRLLESGDGGNEEIDEKEIPF